MLAVAEQNQDQAPADLPQNIDLRVVELKLPRALPKGNPLPVRVDLLNFLLDARESTSIDLVWNPWHCFLLGPFEMANELISFKGPLTVFLGGCIGCIRSHSFRCIFTTASLILYVLGKQVNQFQIESQSRNDKLQSEQVGSE